MNKNNIYLINYSKSRKGKIATVCFYLERKRKLKKKKKNTDLCVKSWVTKS